jgi:hypothetical protein
VPPVPICSCNLGANSVVNPASDPSCRAQWGRRNIHASGQHLLCLVQTFTGLQRVPVRELHTSASSLAACLRCGMCMITLSGRGLCTCCRWNSFGSYPDGASRLCRE